MIKILILLVLVTSCKTFENDFTSKEFQPDPTIYASEERQREYSFNLEVINEINTKRIGKGLSKIAIDSSLVCASENHAQYIGKNRICSHTGKGGSSFWQRAKSCGFRGTSGGEIIACGHKTAKDAVKSWSWSPGHAMIMFGKYKYIGCDMVSNYWVCVFGS